MRYAQIKQACWDMTNSITQLTTGALALITFTCLVAIISFVGRWYNKRPKVDIDLCLILPLCVAGYHALSHSSSYSYLFLAKIPNIPKVIENDWVHFGIVFVILFLAVLLVEKFAVAVTRTNQTVLQDLET